MNGDQANLLVTAREDIEAAELLLEAQHFRIAASRAYYAMFYVAQAFLEGKGMAFSKHSAVIAAFGREFAHPGKVPRHLHRYLIEAQQLRLVADYTGTREVTPDQAKVAITRASEFLDIADRLLGPSSDTGPDPGS